MHKLNRNSMCFLSARLYTTSCGFYHSSSYTGSRRRRGSYRSWRSWRSWSTSSGTCGGLVTSSHHPLQLMPTTLHNTCGSSQNGTQDFKLSRGLRELVHFSNQQFVLQEWYRRKHAVYIEQDHVWLGGNKKQLIRQKAGRNRRVP
jgi:hypothetical protein